MSAYFQTVLPPFDENVEVLLDGPLYDGQFLRDISHDVLVREFLKEAEGKDVCCDHEGGLFVGRKLPWDSAYFGQLCYRVEYLRLSDPCAQLPRVEEWLRSRGVNICFLRASASDSKRFQLASLGPFQLMATKLLFRAEVRPKDTRDQLLSLHSFRGKARTAILDETMDLARKRIVDGRFLSDPRFDPETAVGVYASWVKHATEDEECRFWCLLGPHGSLDGFTIVRLLTRGRRTFGLLELIVAARSGEGIGLRLLGLAEGELGRLGIDRWFTNTDVNNFAAQALYARAGFTPYHAVDEYHAWLTRDGGEEARRLASSSSSARRESSSGK